MPKFDVVIGNPPYKRDLHLKFLNLAIDISKEFVCFIEPSGWVFNNDLKKYRENKRILLHKIPNYNFKLELHNGYFLFPNVHINTYLGISFIDKKSKPNIIVENTTNGEIFEYDDINSISHWGNSNIFLAIKNKLIEGSKKYNLSNQSENSPKYKYRFSFSGIRGHYADTKNGFYWPDFFTFMPKNKIDFIDSNTNQFSFKTQKEKYNFISYLKGDFARFALSLLKIGRNLNKQELASVPWLDFTESWDDEKLYKYFKLTPDEIKFIEERIPKYYD